MLKPHALVAGLALVALAAPRLAGQSPTDLAGMCRAVGDARVGQWASFDVTSVGYTEEGPSDAGTLRLAAIGSERSGDSTLYWFEVRFSGKDPNHSGVIQILTPSLASGMAAPRALIIKAGLQPAMRIPGQLAGLMGKNARSQTAALDWAERCSGAHAVAWESVTVPAGTFRALHLTFGSEGEAWVSREVPFGLVKTRRKDGGMALTGRGSDAKSSISETPLDMSLPGSMPKP